MPAPMDALFEIAFVKHERRLVSSYPIGKSSYGTRVELNLHTYKLRGIHYWNTTIDAMQTTQEIQSSGVDSPNDPVDDNRYLSDEAGF